jgi:hypothetical protein
MVGLGERGSYQGNRVLLGALLAIAIFVRTAGLFTKRSDQPGHSHTIQYWFDVQLEFELLDRRLGSLCNFQTDDHGSTAHLK